MLAFGKEADFSGINGGKESLSISNVFHQAFVQVDEQGTEAAAATGAPIARQFVRQALPQPFIADHPFVFLIRDNHSGSILFLGRLGSNPK